MARVQEWMRSKGLPIPSAATASYAEARKWMRSKGLPIPSAATASYAEARKVLPMEMLREVNRSLCDQLDQSLSIDDCWRGFRVKAEDDTSAQMPGLTHEKREGLLIVGKIGTRDRGRLACAWPAWISSPGDRAIL
ncbi:MAG: hypothetical protein ACI9DF_003507, partial [Verrucomicrobiales bacterium]